MEPNVIADSLVIGGLEFPPSGETERFAITFPPSYAAKQGNQRKVLERLPANGAVLTLSCLQTDTSHGLAIQLYRAQASGAPGPSGSCIVKSAAGGADRPASWSSCRISQRADIRSSTGVPVVTWVFELLDITD